MVHDVETGEISFGYCVLEEAEAFIAIVANGCLHVDGRDHGCELVLLGLVVEESALCFGAFDGFELAPNSRITRSNQRRNPQSLVPLIHDFSADHHHDGVQDPRVTNQLEGTITAELSYVHEHVCPWDADMLKTRPAIVLRVVT